MFAAPDRRRTEDASDVREPAAPPPVRALEALQRSAGNHAVATMLQPRSPQPRLLRWGTGEHAQMGGARSATINGVTLSEGELLAMGDFYAGPDKLNAAPAAELQNLVDLIRREKQYKEGVAGVKKVTTKEWDTATQGHAKGETYTELAFDNDAHYAPDSRSEDQRVRDQLGIYVGHLGNSSFEPKSRKPDNRGEWEKHYRAAAAEARAAGQGGAKTVPDAAIVLNGFAGHFLTDAFSAGHIQAKSEIMDFAKLKWNEMGADETWLDIIPESAFTVAVAEKVLSDPKAGPALKQFQIRIVEWDDMSVTKLSELIYGMQEDSPALFYSMFAGLVHDALNDAIEANDPAGLPPLEVDNARHDGPWQLAGDGNLKLSPQTMQIAMAAVEESYRTLEQAVTDPKGFDAGKAAERVWAYVPRPTVQGAKLLKQVIADYADVSQPKTQEAAAKYIIGELDTVIATLRKKNRLKTPKEVEALKRELMGKLGW